VATGDEACFDHSVESTEKWVLGWRTKASPEPTLLEVMATNIDQGFAQLHTDDGRLIDTAIGHAKATLVEIPILPNLKSGAVFLFFRSI
jgi:hypothetical protein